MMTIFRALTVFVLCVSHSVAHGIDVAKFHNGSLCGVAERARLNCSQMSEVRSSLHCLTQCLQVENCNAVSFGSNGTCALHKDCPYNFECNGDDATFQHMERHCLHGTWDTVTQSCNCPGRYSGARCHIYPRACIKKNDNSEERIFVDPEQTGENPFPVTCWGKLPFAVIMRNKKGMVFNRTWEEYKRGFYIDEHHQWLGFEPWRRLRNIGCTILSLRLMFQKTNSSYSTTYRYYKDHTLSNEENNYQLDYVSTRTGTSQYSRGYTFTDCLGNKKHTPFSTWDNDNDGDVGVNCAARAGTGWWYSPGCQHDCHMMGVGPEFWGQTPSYQQLYLKDADLLSLMTQYSYMEMSLVYCLS